MAVDVQWDPADYAVSSSSQARWGRELIGRKAWSGNEKVVDIGCGNGRLTADLADLVPQGKVVGIDSSREMVDYARETHPMERHPNLEFLEMDARNMSLPSRFDVVFSNAALHWVSDHPAFLHGAARALRPGGNLLVSCGGRGNAETVFTALRAEMRSPAWRRYFRNLEKPYFFHGEEEYERWLPEVGFTPSRIALSPKEAEHESVDSFSSWFRTTWMPYTHRVPEDQRDEFIAAVVKRYLIRRPADPEGRVHVRMVRLEIEADRC